MGALLAALALGVAVCLEPPAHAEVEGPGSPTSLGAELRSQLESPFRNQRRRAMEALRDRARRGEVSLIDLLRDSSAAVRRAAAEVVVETPVGGEAPNLLEALEREADSEVRVVLVDALAHVGVATDERLAPFRAEGIQSDKASQYERYLIGRIRATFESLIHDGTIPGFYDGQFKTLWKLDPQMPERLIAMARDESYHFVIRVLAIMALHETRRPSLEKDLGPLLLDPEEEFHIARSEWFQWGRRLNAARLYLLLRAELSRYARFSLAKAGQTRQIMNMIRRMDQELRMNEMRLHSRSTDDLFAEHQREWLRLLIFETGYFYQQFDDYDHAIERYLRLVQNHPEARACQSAYYNLACIASIRNDRAKALTYLRRAVELGFTDYEWLREDGDLAPLREDAEFQRIIEMARTGQITDAGTSWLVRLTPLLPPGRGFFELTRRQQLEVLEGVAGELTEPEVRGLLRSSPDAQRRWLESTLSTLRARAEGPGDKSAADGAKDFVSDPP